LGYTALLTTVTVFRYHVWLATGWDMGFNLQALWLLAHKGVLAVSTYTGHPVLADAASYILVLLAPLYSVGGVGFLLLLQAFALGLGYLFIRRIAEHFGVEAKWSHLVGVIYLIYPTVLGANLFDFHPDVLAVPLLFAAIWAALEKKWVWYGVVLILALSVKDTVPVAVMGFGVVLLVRRSWVAGVLTLLAGMGVLALDLFVVIPHLLHGSTTQWLAYFGGLQSAPSVSLGQIWRDPLVLLHWVKELRSWEYLAWLLGPVGVLIALGRRQALSAFWVPSLLLMETNLLASPGVMTDPLNEFSLMAVPFLFVVALEAQRGLKRFGPAVRNASLSLPVVLLLAFVWHVHGPDWSDRPPNSQALAAAAVLIPRDAPVVAPNALAAYFADRPQVNVPSTVIGRTLSRGTYVIFDTADPLSLVDPDPAGTDGEVHRAVSAVGIARVVFSQDQVTVYRLVRRVKLPSPGGA